MMENMPSHLGRIFNIVNTCFITDVRFDVWNSEGVESIMFDIHAPMNPGDIKNEICAISRMERPWASIRIYITDRYDIQELRRVIEEIKTYDTSFVVVDVRVYKNYSSPSILLSFDHYNNEILHMDDTIMA